MVPMRLLHTGDPEFTRITAPELGWDAIARDGVAVYRISGSHLSLHEVPHVNDLSAKMRLALAPQSRFGEVTLPERQTVACGSPPSQIEGTPAPPT